MQESPIRVSAKLIEEFWRVIDEVHADEPDLIDLNVRAELDALIRKEGGDALATESLI